MGEVTGGPVCTGMYEVHVCMCMFGGVLAAKRSFGGVGGGRKSTGVEVGQLGCGVYHKRGGSGMERAALRHQDQSKFLIN